jgi:hypothetical protein
MSMRELEELERELRHVRQRLAKLPEGDPARAEPREQERQLWAQFVSRLRRLTSSSTLR